VRFGFWVWLRLALRSFASSCVCEVPPYFVSGWRAISSVALCNDYILYYRFTERDGRKGPPAGNKARCNRTNTTHSKVTQREDGRKGPPAGNKARCNRTNTTHSKVTQREAKPNQTLITQPTDGARDRPRPPQPKTKRDHASGSGQRHASRRTRPPDTGTRCPGKGQR
jgi:hypothetical protein